MPNESPVEPAPNVVVADPYAEFLAEHKKRDLAKKRAQRHIHQLTPTQFLQA